MKQTILLLLIGLGLQNALAQNTMRILTIGNSFSADAVEQYLYELGNEAGYDLIIGNAYRAGQGLESHWNVVSQGEAKFEYHKIVDGKKTNQKGLRLDSIAKDEPWDVITFQQVSQDAGLGNTYSPYLEELMEYVKQLVGRDDVRYGFQQTWAYAQNSTHSGFVNYKNDQQEMYNCIVTTVHDMLEKHPDISFCIPTGTAIQNMRTSVVGDHMNRDGYHLDYTLGRYTAACTWLEALTGVSPVGMTYCPKTIRRKELAAVAQQAAHDAMLNPETITPETESLVLLDSCRISVFGSSVAHGTGAKDDHGYAYLYNQQLKQRNLSGTSPYAFETSDICIGGNTTTHLLNRYHDLVYDLGRYVVFGVSLGNEGIHNSSRQQEVANQWCNNIQRLAEMARNDGKVPVVMNNYGRRDFTAKDYNCVKQTNLKVQQWDMPSVNLLGAIDDGAGHWVKGYENDAFHPNSLGHKEMMLAIPPSLFDALAMGKTVPERDKSKELTLSRGNTLRFTPEGMVHPYAISLVIQGGDRGRLVTLTGTNGRSAWIGVNRDHKVYYCAASGDSIVCPIPLEDNVRHTITLSHRYAARHTLFYLDTEGLEVDERLQLASVCIGDATSKGTRRKLSELFFWRSALNHDEIVALAKGNMLRSSLEIYAATDNEEKDSLTNLAQSMNNTLRFVKYSNPHSRQTKERKP